MKSDSNPTPSKKPFIYYYLIAMLVVLLLNAMLFPSLLQRQVTEVYYNEFLSMVEAGQVTEVALEEDGEQIVFAATGEDGKEAIYKTGVWPDDDLQQVLSNAGVNYAATIPTQNSPLLNFILTWIFPILLIVVIGQLS